MKIANRFTHIVLALLLSLSAASCHHDSPEDPSEPEQSEQPGDENDGGTVLVYMVAANDLGYNGLDTSDINEMIQGMKKVQTINPSRLLIYHSAYGKVPVLKQIHTDGTITELKSYPSTPLSVSIARMREVIADASTEPDLYPLRGIVLWSHGTGWIEESTCYDDPDLPQPLSFGKDAGSKRMSVPALAAALADAGLRFIYFDCCLMGTVEVAYELRHAAEKIAACATELPLEGAPYDMNIPHFFSGKDDAMEQASQVCYDYYMTPQASTQSVALVVVRTDELDNLAAASRRVMETGALPDADYAGIPFFRPSVVSTGSYDMTDYYTTLGAPEEWHTAYSRAVTFHIATPKSYGLDMTHFNGLGSGIFTSPTDIRLNYGYRSLQWYTDVVSHHPILSTTE